MRALVTGGAGFIGSHVVDALIDDGHSVIVADDLSSGSPGHVHNSAILIHEDIRSPTFRAVFEQNVIDVVFHLAAHVDVATSVRNPQLDADVNIMGTLGLLSLCIEFGVQRVVYSSTGGAIYGSPAVLPASEDCPPVPLSPYGASKLAGEEYIKVFARNSKLTYGILRYSNVYGPRQLPKGEGGVCAVFAQRLLRGESPILYGHGSPIRDYVYVYDVARANLLAMKSERNIVVNISSGLGTTVSDIFLQIGEIVGSDIEPRYEPLRPGEVQDTFLTNALARKLIGWSPEVALEVGLEATVDYFCERLANAD